MNLPFLHRFQQSFIPLQVSALLVLAVMSNSPADAQETSSFRIGVIGLDTSHAPAFAKLWNDAKASGLYAKQQIVVAFPGGSPDIESSISRVPKYTEELTSLGVEIVPSVDDVLSKVDAVIIHSLDGRKHLEQAAPVLKARKPLFIDKPLAGTLDEAIAIKKLADHYQTKWFSSSSLRFSAGFWKYRSDEKLRNGIQGALSWGPCSLESTHPDLFWYGVHGVETLYTAMGVGCESVSRTSSTGTDVVVGKWKGGRFGVFRGNRDTVKDAYGLVIFGAHSDEISTKFDGYAPLVAQIAQFFDGGLAPVAADETIEMFAFMEAADESKRRNGAPVSIKEVMETANRKADLLVQKHLK